MWTQPALWHFQARGGTVVERLSIKLKVQGSKPSCGGQRLTAEILQVEKPVLV